MIVAEALKAAARSGVEKIDSRALLAHVLQVSRGWLIAHDLDAIPAAQFSEFEVLLARRKNGEPLAYLVGTKDFFGRIFFCSPVVLVPRPETELLVESALRSGDAVRAQTRSVLDLGCGSGCVGLTIACERPHWHVTLADISQSALAVAQRNADHLHIAPQVSLVHSNWFSAFSGHKFDLIVSNPPYVAAGDAHLGGDGLRYEPTIALTDGQDGLSVYRQFAESAWSFLSPGGALIVEHGYDQGSAVRALLRAQGMWQNIETIKDLSGNERVTRAHFE